MTDYSTGLEAIKRAKDEIVKAKQQRESGWTKRFRLRPGEKASITFLDVPSIGVYEHSIKRGEKIYDPVQCTNNELGEGDCPHCATGIRRAYELVGTIINHNKYSSKDGMRTYENQKQLIVLKGRGQQAMLEYLDDESADYMDVTHKVFSVKRPDIETSVACGETFIPKGKIKLDKLKAMAPEGTTPEDYIKPFDYMTLFTISAPAFKSGGADMDPFVDPLEDDDEDEPTEDKPKNEDVESLL